MSKDPAFLLYHQDFFSGVSDMTNEEVGAYILCLCIQASKGGITEKHMKNICKTQDVHDVVKTKFVFNVSTNLLENMRLVAEMEKRKKYSESRANNRKGKTKSEQNTNNISKSYVNHMEDENENRNEVIKVKVKPAKTDLQFLIDRFNEKCVKLPKVKALTDTRITALRNRLDEHGADQIEVVFELVSESDFLNGENGTGWTASIDWVLKPQNFTKILEGNYKNKHTSKNEFNALTTAIRQSNPHI